jgi:mutator family transposase
MASRARDAILGTSFGGRFGRGWFSVSVRDIAGHLSGLYGVEVGRDTISRVTDAVLEEVQALAHQAARAGLSDRVLRRADGQGP